MRPENIKRIKRVQQLLAAQEKSAALIISSAPSQARSRDQDYPYTVDSDFYYLTGISDPDYLLLISNTDKSIYLYTKKNDPIKVIWDGTRTSANELAHNLSANLIITNQIKNEVLKKLAGIRELYYQNIPNSMAWEIANKIITTSSHLRGDLPLHFSHSDAILESMRLHKDKQEINLIKKASQVSYEALRFALPLVTKGAKENDIAAAMEYYYRISDCEPAFSTIVAGGKNGATLHHRASSYQLRSKDMVLIDWGAASSGYASDITRSFPVSGRFSDLQKDLYEIVLAAQLAAISKIRHGALIKSLYDAAAKILTEGLIELKILRGKASSHFDKKSYKPFFPHGIGHSLGLDVHDIGNLRGNNQARLEKGMVFTVEPGLYFRKKTQQIPACGIRIEDTVLVTQSGCEILTSLTPKTISQIEEWIKF